MNKMRTAANKEIRTELNKAIRLTAVPIVAELKAAVMSIDSHVTGNGTSGPGRDSSGRFISTRRLISSGGGEAARAQHAGSGKSQANRNHGLRATIARAIQVKITYAGNRVGVRLRVDGTKLAPDQRTLPMALDKPKFRHPVFGQDVWVDQTGKARWWQDTVYKHAPEIRAEMIAAMDRAFKSMKR
jgi:hypothetical protein